MAKEPDMVMMNYNAVYEDGVDLTETLNAGYVLIKKLESIKDIDLSDIQWALDKLKEILRKRGSKI